MVEVTIRISGRSATGMMGHPASRDGPVSIVASGVGERYGKEVTGSVFGSHRGPYMALRFRKSITLAPGIRMNLSGSGASFSLGGRGASVTVGKRGTFLNAGIPGTGISSRQKLGGPTRSSSSSTSGKRTVDISVSVGITDDGTLYFKDELGYPLDEKLIARVKKQKGDLVKGLMQEKCDEINREIEALGEIHLETPAPEVRPTFELQEFPELIPEQPAPKSLGFFASLFSGKRDRLAEENRQSMNHYLDELRGWQHRKEEFGREQQRRRQFIEEELRSSVSAKESYLAELLQRMAWPRETVVATELRDNGVQVFIDVDLPELEEMPHRTAALPQRGYKLSVKEMSANQILRLYMSHVHGIGFRLIGEIFCALQDSREVVLSAFTQRNNPATGIIQNDYLYSVRVDRDQWSGINFQNLKSIDVVDALARFELRRNMSKSGVFTAIQPFEVTAE